MVKEDRSTWKAKYTMRLTVDIFLKKNKINCSLMMNQFMCSAILSFFGNIENNFFLRAIDS